MILWKGRGELHDGIYEAIYRPPSTPKGSVVLIHGLPGWITKNLDLAELIASEGYEAHVPHLPGLGMSQEPFGIRRSWEALNPILERLNPALPMLFVGHSWGGLAALQLLKKWGFGAILLNPLWNFPDPLLQDHAFSEVVSFIEKEMALVGTPALREDIASEMIACTLQQRDFDKILLQEKKPVTVILGEEDMIIPIGMFKPAMDALSGRVETVVLPKENHLLMQNRKNVQAIFLTHLQKLFARAPTCAF